VAIYFVDGLYTGGISSDDVNLAVLQAGLRVDHVLQVFQDMPLDGRRQLHVLADVAMYFVPRPSDLALQVAVQGPYIFVQLDYKITLGVFSTLSEI